MGNVPATSLAASSGRLLIGKPDGGLAIASSQNGKMMRDIPGQGDGATGQAVYANDEPWWCVSGSSKLLTIDPDLDSMSSIEAGIGPIVRLSLWQRNVVVYSKTEFRFVDLTTHRVFTPEQVLPSEIASEARQGVVNTSWSDGAGIFLLVRRYGKHREVSPGQNADIALINAWSSNYKLLGGHTTNLFQFSSGPGPQVHVPLGKEDHVSDYGTTGLGNLAMSAEGFVGIGQDELEAVPFGKKDWETEHVKLPIVPHYNATLCQFDSEAWWTDGRLVYRASLEDGSTEIYVQKTSKPSMVKSIVADSGSTWLLTDTGVRRVDFASFVRYAAAGLDAIPTTARTVRLQQAIVTLMQKHGDRSSFVKQALLEAGLPIKRPITKLEPVIDDQLRYGDVILDGARRSIYVGKGMVADGNLTLSPLTVDENARIVRPFEDEIWTYDHQRIQATGLGQPCDMLGNPYFVEMTQGTEYDRPYLPLHERMAQIVQNWLGVPYRWGGNTQEGVDCSGFVCAVFRELGVSLPRYSQDIGQAHIGSIVTGQLRYGDVLVYSWPHKHCAIYMGNGNVVEAISGGVTYHALAGHPFAIVRRFL